MIIIGEKLNSSIPSTLEAMSAKDEVFVKELAARQAAAGAHYLDINTGMCEDEGEALIWAVKLAQEAAPDCGIMADSANPSALSALFDTVEMKKVVINSVTLEDYRLEGVLPLVKKFGTGIVAMPIDGEGMPQTAQRRVENADRLIGILREEGVKDQDIYVDVVVEAAATGWDVPQKVLEAIRTLRGKYPQIHILGGLSNISFGLPKRGTINQSFLACAMTQGMDAPIMDVTNQAMKMHLCATEMLLGQDEYCMNYLGAFREMEGN